MVTPAPSPAPTPGSSGELDPLDETVPDDHPTGGGDDQASEPVLVSVDQPRPGTRNPHQSRVRALKVLFQADLRGEDLSATVAGIAIDPAAVALLDDLDVDGADDAPGDDGLDDYARTLIDGVALRRHAIDRILSRFSHRWEVNRMPVVDRNILRLGAWELLFEDVSPAVVIDEALELAKQHSTDASHRFVNGILEAVRRDAADLRTELTNPSPDLDLPADVEADDLEDVDPEDVDPEDADGLAADGGASEPAPGEPAAVANVDDDRSPQASSDGSGADETESVTTT